MWSPLKSTFYIIIVCLGLVQHGQPSAESRVRSRRSVSPYLELSVRRYLPEAVRLAARWLQATVQHEARYARTVRGKGKTADHGAFDSVSSFLGSSPEAKKMSYAAFIESKALTIIKKRFKLDKRMVLELLVDGVLDSPLLPDRRLTAADQPVSPPALPMCPYPRNLVCSPRAHYRTYDGRCNNPQRPLLGASFQPLGRFIYPDYADGIEEPRRARSGAELPNARLVSTTVHDDADAPSHVHTLMLMQFGQFLDHDLSRTAISKLAADEKGFEVEDVSCGDDGCRTGSLEHATCWPIWVPQNDTAFKDERCLMFVRTIEVPNADCELGPRQQLNQVTAYLDGSHVYGSTKEQADQLRDTSQPGRGRLKMMRHPFSMWHKPLLPAWYNFTLCKSDNPDVHCFLAGDTRVNEHVGLMTMHTMLAREHNRMEARLHVLNPHWDAERLFQETRRIVVAMWQHMVYNEYLSVLLGPNVMKMYNLDLQPTGFYNGYDVSVRMDTANVFATAAFRFGHSQIQSLMQQMDSTYASRNDLLLSNTFRMPSEMYDTNHEGADSILRGLCGHHAQTVDNHITQQVTRHLFSEHPPAGLGTDLAAINIQRGRDHGLPGYNTWREWCGLGRVSSFHELANNPRGRMPEHLARKFQSLYLHVDDIDLFPAGVSELPEDGAVLGATLSCIIATQFRKLRHGDRFWYENFKDHPYPFTQAQLSSIRKSRVAKLLCENSDHVTQMQPHVLLVPATEAIESAMKTNDYNAVWWIRRTYASINSNNDRVPCSTLPDIDLTAWKEVSPNPAPAPEPYQSNLYNVPPTPALAPLTSAQLSLLHHFNGSQRRTDVYGNVQNVAANHPFLINPNLPPQIVSLGGALPNPFPIGGQPPNQNRHRRRVVLTGSSATQQKKPTNGKGGTGINSYIISGEQGNVRFRVQYPSGR